MRVAGFLIIFLTTSCSAAQKPSSAEERGRVIGARLDSASIGDTITLRSLVSGVGDSLYVFPPYTPDSVVTRALGFHWPELERTSIRDYDNVTLWVLTANGSVVAWHEQLRTVDLADLERGCPYPGDARFAVDSAPANGRGWRRLVAVH